MTPRQSYEQEYYHDNKTKARLRMRQRIAERKEWLAKEMDQPCWICGSQDWVEWHDPDPAFDYDDPAMNTATLRRLANEGAAYKRIEKALSTLLPYCRKCHNNRPFDVEQEFIRRQRLT